MFATIVIIFEIIAVLFLGIFARTNSLLSLSTTYGSLFNNCLMLMFSFTLMYTPFRKFNFYTLVSLLIVVSVTAQFYFLIGVFWDSVFSGFSSSFDVGLTLITRSIFVSLSVLLTFLDFVGIFIYWQVYIIIGSVMAFGFSLCSAIIIKGLKSFDGGGGLLVFMFSGVCSLVIWSMCVRGKIERTKYKIQTSYINKTLGLIGLILGFINWPKFNMAGCLISYSNVDTTSLTSQSYLMNSSLGNTYLALSASILISMIFASKQTPKQRMKYNVYIDCFINGGIIIASYQDISTDPVSCIIMSSLSSFVTLIIHKYVIVNCQTMEEGVLKDILQDYSKVVYRIGLPIIGIIICSIVVAGRSSKMPALLTDNYSRIAGLEILSFIIVFIFAIIFGSITAVCISIYLSYRQKDSLKNQQLKNNQLSDSLYFNNINDEVHPLYYDVYKGINLDEGTINMKRQTSKMIKQSLLGANQTPLRMMTTNTKVQNRPNPKHQRLVLIQDYTKSLLKNKDQNNNVSKMKIDDSEPKQKAKIEQSIQSEKISEGHANPRQQLPNRQKLYSRQISDKDEQSIQQQTHLAQQLKLFQRSFRKQDNEQLSVQ